MLDPQPRQVLENPADELGPASARVKILDPKSELAPAGPGLGMPHDGRKSMAEMQASRGGGGETCDLQDSLHDKGVPGDS